MERELSAHGIRPYFISAYSPETIPIHLLKRFRTTKKPKILPRERACFASHLCALEHILRIDNNQFCLVLEDDVKLNETLSEVDLTSPYFKDYDMVRIHGDPKTPSFLIGRIKNLQLVEYFRAPAGTCAYLINKNGSRKILDAAWEVDLPYDIFLRKTWMTGLLICGLIPAPICHLSVLPSVLRPEGPEREPTGRFSMKGEGLRRRLSGVWQIGRRHGVGRMVRFLWALVRMKVSGFKCDSQGEFVIH